MSEHQPADQNADPDAPDALARLQAWARQDMPRLLQHCRQLTARQDAPARVPHAPAIAAAAGAAGTLHSIVRALALDDAPATRLLAVQVLQHCPPDDEILHRLALWLASDGSERVREAALRLLGHWCLPDSRLHRLASSLLGSPAVTARRFAVRILGHAAAAPVFVAMLLPALQDSDWSIRCCAAAALAHMPDEQARSTLRNALHDPDEDVRHSAALALAQQGDSSTALAALAADLAHEHARVREGAIAALAQMEMDDSSQTSTLLLPLLRADDWATRRSAALALWQGGAHPAAAETLLHDAQDARWFVRQRAAEALAAAGAFPGVLEMLLALLSDSDWLVRQSAAEALGHIGDTRAVAALARLMGDEEGDVWQSAAEALGRIGTDEARQTLLAALQQSDKTIQQHATEALGHVGGEQAIATLAQVLTSAGTGSVRQRAAEVLGRLGDARALEPLLAVLEDKDDNATTVRQRAAEALGRLGDTRAIEPLLAALEDSSQQVRASAAEALGRLGQGDTELFSQLAGRATVGHTDLRASACLALKKLLATGPQRAFRVAARNLGYPGMDAASYEVLFEMVGRCAFLGLQAADEALQEMAESEDTAERSAAAAILGELLPLNPEAVLPLLERLAQDSDWTVREAVALAPGRRGLCCLEPAAVLLAPLIRDEELAVALAALITLAHLTGARLTPGDQRRLHRSLHSPRHLELLQQWLGAIHAKPARGFAPVLLARPPAPSFALQRLLEEPALLGHAASAALSAPDQAARAHELRHLLHTLLFEPPPADGAQVPEMLDRLLHLLPDPLLVYIIYRQAATEELRAASQVFYELASLMEQATTHTPPREGDASALHQHLPQRLERLVSGFRRLPQFARGQRYAATFAALRHLLLAASLSEIITALTSAEAELRRLPRSSTPGEYDLSLLLARLREVVLPLRQYSEEASPALRTAPLSETISRLESFSQDVESSVLQPYRMMLQQVVRHWRELLRHAILRQEGQAHLELATSEEVVAGDSITIALQLHNRGPAPAHSLRVRMQGSGLQHIAPTLHSVPTLAASESLVLTFSAHSQQERCIAEFLVIYDDLLTSANRQQYTAHITLHATGPAWQYIPNPYLPGRPYPERGRAANRLFVGRKDILRFVQENILEAERERIVVLYGHRRTGKTWTLLRLLETFPPAYLPVYIDVQEMTGIQGVPAFLQNVADEILHTLHARPPEAPDAPAPAIRVPTWEQYEQNYPYYFKRVFLRDVQQALGERRLLLLFDEFQGLDDMVESGRLPESFMGFLRNLMQFGQQMAFIFAGTREMTGRYWSVFFNIAVHRKIGVLKQHDATTLISEPVRHLGVEHDRFAIPLIRQLTGNHPYFIQLLCDRIVAELNARQQMLVNAQVIEAAVEDLVINGASNLKFHWTDVMNESEQAVAGMLQDLLRRRKPADINTLWREMSSINPRISTAAILEAVRGLVDKDLLEKDRAALDTYRFKIGLVEHYIGAHILYTDIQQQIGRLW